MKKLFLSYRRSDSVGHSGRIQEDLAAVYGEENVFRDLDTMRPGVDFPDAVREAIAESDAVLVLVGPQWVSAEGKDGSPRIFAEGDWVRIEVREALAAGKWVIPVLVGGAGMPRSEEIPEDLQALRRANAIEISDSRWLHDMERLVSALSGEEADRAVKRLLAGKRPPIDAKPFVAIGILVLLLLLDHKAAVFNLAASAVAAGLCVWNLLDVRRGRARGALVTWVGLLASAGYLAAIVASTLQAI